MTERPIETDSAPQIPDGGTLDAGEPESSLQELRELYQAACDQRDQVHDHLAQLAAAHRQLEQEFDDRTRWLQDREQRLREQESKLLALRDEFDERTRWALELDARVAERDARIYQLEADLDEAKDHARRLRAELDRRDVKIAELQAQLAETTGWLLELKGFRSA